MGYHWAKHLIIGGACAALSYKVAERMIIRSEIPENEQKKYLLAALGASGGGAVGYFLGEQRCDNNGERYDSNKKLVSTILGVAGGGLLGYAIGGGLVDKINGIGSKKSEVAQDG
jgi:uncharacterized protein YcfJ